MCTTYTTYVLCCSEYWNLLQQTGWKDLMFSSSQSNSFTLSLFFSPPLSNDWESILLTLDLRFTFPRVNPNCHTDCISLLYLILLDRVNVCQLNQLLISSINIYIYINFSPRHPCNIVLISNFSRQIDIVSSRQTQAIFDRRNFFKIEEQDLVTEMIVSRNEKGKLKIDEEKKKKKEKFARRRNGRERKQASPRFDRIVSCCNLEVEGNAVWAEMGMQLTRQLTENTLVPRRAALIRVPHRAQKLRWKVSPRENPRNVRRSFKLIFLSNDLKIVMPFVRANRGKYN